MACLLTIRTEVVVLDPLSQQTRVLVTNANSQRASQKTHKPKQENQQTRLLSDCHNDKNENNH